MDDELDPDEISRRVQANQQPPGVLIARALAAGGVTDLGLAQAVLENLQRHYELKPR
jgi:hypothetical protein